MSQATRRRLEPVAQGGPTTPPDGVLRLSVDRTPTPIGHLMLLADTDGRLRAAHFADQEEGLLRMLTRQYGAKGFALQPARDPHGLTAAVDAYFDGDLHAIDALPVALVGTDFQRAVWTALREIPVGTTVSYSELARRIGRPDAVRAVGLANGANPVGVVVPCHRVVGMGGTLVGYGGGISRKRWLLDHESSNLSLWPTASR
jgi:methylated-DNA-[protein]-cysteine S-methyltransferase